MRNSLIVVFQRLAILATLVSPAAVAQGTVQPLGDLPGGLGASCFGMSADGSVIVGFSYYIAPGGLLASHAVVWTQATGMQAVFDGGLDYTSAAFAVSADGLFIGGWHALTITEEKAFIWSAAGGEMQLATRSGVMALSGDGTIGAGYVVHGRGEPPRASIWVDGNQTFIDSPNVIQPGSEARGISADGTVVVGVAMFSPTTASRGFRWSEATGMQNLGGPNFTDPTNDAYAATPDGSVIVGWVGPAPGGTDPTQPARWTQATGWQLLGNLPGGSGGGIAYAVSSDGNTVVGTSNGKAFIWRQDRGLEDLATVAGAPGWTFSGASAISADGKTILVAGSDGVGIAGPCLVRLPCFSVSNVPDVSTCLDGSASFTVVPTGSGPFTYSWRMNTNPIDPATNPTAATATLVLNNLSSVDAGSYDCVVSDACGSVTSNAAMLSVCDLVADLNCDAAVDLTDLATQLAHYGQSNVPRNDGDLNGDGIVDLTDLAAMLAIYGAACP